MLTSSLCMSGKGENKVYFMCSVSKKLEQGLVLSKSSCESSVWKEKKVGHVGIGFVIPSW